MVYKQKGFPMHSTSSALKQIVDEPVVTEESDVVKPQVEGFGATKGLAQGQFEDPKRKLANEAQMMVEQRGYQDIDPNSPGYKEKKVVTEEETVPTPPKYPKIKIDDEGHKTMFSGWEIDPITGKKVPRYLRF